MKKILIIGGGGREHALAWKCAQSESVEKVFVAPGNAGTASERKCENVEIAADDIAGLLTFAQENTIDLTVVGPDDPLADGVVDIFKEEGLRIFGPTRAAAKLEWSKSFTKNFLQQHNIPTAAYKTFDTVTNAKTYIQAQSMPIVVKADGLAAGKGVLVAQTHQEAISFAQECLDGGRFGKAGARIVVEEFMEGEEASYTALCDGVHYVALPTSQDHKLALDGDKGEQTGGMGAYSPAPVVTNDVDTRIRSEVVEPILRGMQAEDAPFIGFLYIGLMIKDGSPRVVEVNARFGDPETQPLLMRLKSDLIELMEQAIDGELDSVEAQWDERAALGVVMTAGGYPESYEKGKVISGLVDADSGSDSVKVFHAGTLERDGAVVTSGGRVLCVTALGRTIQDAKEQAYTAVAKISWEGERHRGDIGWRVAT